jgi:hypothetical protein
MKQESKNEKISELLDINLKMESKEKLAPIKIHEQLSKTKIKITNSLNRTHLPPINKDKIRNSTANKVEHDINIHSKISSVKKEKDKDKELNEEQFDNKSTKNSFNTSDINFSFKHLNTFIKQESKEKKLKIIQELSPESKINLRNIELVRKMSEKVKKVREDKIMQLNKHRQTPMERFNNVKKFFQIKVGAGSPRPFDHRKFELFNDSKEGKNNSHLYKNDNIYFYEIIYGGNSSEIIEDCLKRRNQWKVYQRNNDDYFLFYNNINNSNNVSSSLNPPSSTSSNLNNLKFSGQSYMNFANFYNSNNENNPLPNFIWSHSSTRLDFTEFSKYRPAHIKKMTNHFEFHKEISNKMNLFLNMMIYCECFNLDLFSMVPLTFPIRYESQNYIDEISSFNNIFNNINKYVEDKPLNYKYRNLFDLELKGRTGYKTSLHIPKTHYCGRNLWLIKAIDLNRGRCIKISDNISGIESIIKHFYKGMKRSFFKMVTKEVIDDEEKEKENFDDIQEITKNKKNKTIHIKINNNNANETNNITSNVHKQNKKASKLINNKIHLPSLITSNINNETHITNNSSNNKDKSRNNKEAKNQNTILNNNNKNTFTNIGSSSVNKGSPLLKNNPKTYQNSNIIIQKYIEKPLCYNGRKCDMRLWVLLTWDFNLYLFKEGHFKATSLPYDVNSQDSYVHITNYSVQKYNKNFAKFETGNEISFQDFENSVNNSINVKKDLLPSVKEIIIHSMKSVAGKINKAERKICFEIFGYDFMFDENYKPYLLEVNTNPGLEISSPLIEMLIPRMLDDAFKLTIDQVFFLNKANIDKMKEKPYKVDGYSDDENMWELLCNIVD